MTITQKITQAIDQFETIKRASNGEEIVILKDTAPDSLKNAVREAHGDRMPDDWIFSTFLQILEAFSEREITTADDLDEAKWEVATDLVDPYTANLTAWLARHNGNMEYVSTMIEEGTAETADQLLSQAQMHAIEEIATYVIGYLTMKE